MCARAHCSMQAGAVNGSRARALAARPPNLRRSLAPLLNVSPWKGKNHAKTQKPSWIKCSIGPKTGKVDDFQRFPHNPSTFSRPKKSKSMISSCFPEIHRLSQNRQNAKSMISGCFPKIHRLSQNRQTAKSMISSRFSKNHRLSQNRQTAKSMISSHFPEIHRLSAKKGLGSGDICRPKGRSAPLACCLPHAGGWKSGQGQAARWEVACRGASGPLDGTASRWHSARSKAEGANTHGS